MIQSTLQERISAHSLFYLLLFLFLRFKNKLWNRVGTLRSIFSSALGTDSRLSRTKKSWKKFSEVRLLVFGTETTALSDISLSPSRLKNFLVRRARVRDDPGRSPQIELEPERSFVRPLSGQSVYEQTSGVLRHTESVRGHKVQEQDCASFSYRAHRKFPALPPWKQSSKAARTWRSAAQSRPTQSVSSTEQATARAPTRELEGTAHRSFSS